MTKKYNPGLNQAESALLQEVVRSGRMLLQDPLWSSILAFRWLRMPGWNMIDTSALKLGVININTARAGANYDVALDLLDRASSMVGSAGSALVGARVGGLPGAAIGAASGIAQSNVDVTQASYSKKPSQEQISAAFQILGDAGLIK